MRRTKKSPPIKHVVRGRNLARHGKAADVTVHEDPKRVAEYERLMALIAQGKKAEAVGFDEYWEAVGRVLDRNLYLVGGFADANAWLAKVVKQPLRSVRRLVRVARHATPTEEALYTTSKLDAALAFIEAKTGGPVKGHLPVRWEAFRIPIHRKNKPLTLSLDEVTVAEINAATRELLAGTSRSRAHHSPSEAALHERFAGHAQFAGTAIHVHDGAVRFGPVPLDAIDEFVRLLRGFKVPEAK